MKGPSLVQQLLRRKLGEAQSQNPQYSLRAFAKRAGLSAGAVSAILNGKRLVSSKIAERLARNLLLDPQERSELLTAFPRRSGAKGADTIDPRYLELSAAQYRIVADWEHFAILSLLKTSGFKNDAEWIAERLGISTTRARSAVARLLDLGMAEKSSEGELTRSQPSFRSSDDVADLSVRKSHEQTLDLAKESLRVHSVAQRDHTAVTMAIDPARMPQAKELIRRFQDELAALVEGGTATEVYRLAIQLFPLSKPTEKT